MMHFRQRALIADERQAKRHDRKRSKWRKGPRNKRYRKLVKTQAKTKSEDIQIIITWIKN
jgi:hypothetical protein